VPGAAQVALALEDHQVVVAESPQLDRRTDAAEPGADDRGVVDGLGHVALVSVQIIALSGTTSKPAPDRCDNLWL
jgi:hypothetical protein